MEEKFFDFAHTKEALSQLSADMAVLSSEAQNKLTAMESERKNNKKILVEKDAKIAEMSQTIRNTIAKIDSITGYIDGVL